MLRELSANNPAVRSWLLKFAREFKAEETRRIAAEQGIDDQRHGGAAPVPNRSDGSCT